MMRFGRISKQPSPYRSPLLFHAVRTGQVLSSVVVTSILGFFIHHLSVELYYVPWTFILLIAVSVLTLASFLVTSALHYNRTPKPKTNAYINAFLSILWMLGFALLAWNLSGLLSHQCTIDNWTSDLGVMVCRIYKALMSFAVIGMITTLLALTLDILTHRQSAQLGAYNSMGGASARVSIIKTPLQAFSDLHSDPAMDSPYREPDLEIPEFSHDMKKPYKTQRPIEVAQFGYAAPSEQTSYGGAYSGFEHEKEDGDLGMGMAALGRGYSDREGV